jgi:cytidyltransferase-like protein
MKYKHLVVGGTFDVLHIGHRFLLGQAFMMGEFVSIGLTSDRFNKSRDKKTYQNQTIRKSVLSKFLKEQDSLSRSKIVIISDIYGTTLTDPTLEAIVVTSDTLKGALDINKQRINNKLPPLEIIEVKLIVDENKNVISSSRIRQGEIDPLGANYKQILLDKSGKRIANGTRKKLKSPLGKLYSENIPFNPNVPTISVGDITTRRILRSNATPKLSIVDFKTKRDEKFNSLTELGFKKGHKVQTVENRPGSISEPLILKIESALKSSFENQVILVSGEEDLAVIPAVLLSPLGAKVMYGQPDQGIVEIEVNLQTKQKLTKLIKS